MPFIWCGAPTGGRGGLPAVAAADGGGPQPRPLLQGPLHRRRRRRAAAPAVGAPLRLHLQTPPSGPQERGLSYRRHSPPRLSYCRAHNSCRGVLRRTIAAGIKCGNFRPPGSLLLARHLRITRAYFRSTVMPGLSRKPRLREISGHHERRAGRSQLQCVGLFALHLKERIWALRACGASSVAPVQVVL